MKPAIQRRAALVLGALTAVMVLTAGLRILGPDPAAETVIAAAPARRPAPEGTLLDVNAATAEELEALPGIGPALAERILARREENGPFRSPEDLQAVSGIGEAICRDILPFITFSQERGTTP